MIDRILSVLRLDLPSMMTFLTVSYTLIASAFFKERTDLPACSDIHSGTTDFLRAALVTGGSSLTSLDTPSGGLIALDSVFSGIASGSGAGIPF